jgi:hypothetical protein
MDKEFYLVRHGQGLKRVRELGPLPHPAHVRVRKAMAYRPNVGVRAFGSDGNGNRHVAPLPSADAQAAACRL